MNPGLTEHTSIQRKTSGPSTGEGESHIWSFLVIEVGSEIYSAQWDQINIFEEQMHLF